MKRIIMLITAALIECLLIYAHAQNVLTLDECRQLAIRNNRELKIAEKKSFIADNDRKRAFTKYFPNISATGAYLWNQKDLQLVNPAELGAAAALIPNLADVFHLDIQNIWIGGVTLVQPVFMGGQIILANQIADYAKELAESMRDSKLQDVIYRTDEAYWQVVSLVHKKKLADAYVGLLSKMNDDVVAMITEGVATKAEGMSVKVKLNEAQTAQARVDNGLALSRMALMQICGMPVDTVPPVLEDEMPETIADLINPAVADVSRALSNRPELQSLALASRIYKKKESIAFGKLLPSAALIANYSVMNPNLRNGYSKEFGGMFHIGATLSVPLSGWWEGSYLRNSAKAETLIAQLEYDDTREKIKLQVTQSSHQMNEAKKRMNAAARNMESAEENLRLASDGFAEGVIPALNLMEAQTAWVSSRSEYIDSQINMRLVNTYLSKAMGDLVGSKSE